MRVIHKQVLREDSSIEYTVDTPEGVVKTVRNFVNDPEFGRHAIDYTFDKKVSDNVQDLIIRVIEDCV